MNKGFDGLYESEFVYNSYFSFNLTVNVNNNKYIFYVNKLITSHTDNLLPYLSGAVGLRGYISTVLYSNFNVDHIKFYNPLQQKRMESW